MGNKASKESEKMGHQTKNGHHPGGGRESRSCQLQSQQTKPKTVTNDQSQVMKISDKI